MHVHRSPRPRHRALAILALAVVATVLPLAPAQAADPPANDDFADALVIGSVPFQDLGTFDGATREEEEPPCAEDDTVWYSFSPQADADLVARMELDGDGDGSLGVFAGAGPEDLREVACTFGWDGTVALGFRAEVGTTYFIQLGEFVGDQPGDFGFVLEEDANGKIEGVITDEQDQPIEACAGAWTPEIPSEDEGEEAFPTSFGSAGTDALGRFHIGNLPTGDYRVEFFDCRRPFDHLDEWYEDRPDRETSDLVHVEAGQTTGGIDAALALGASITGTVTDETGSPVEGVCVIGRGGAGFREAATDAAGRYTLTGFPSGTAVVGFEDEDECDQGDYLTEWYDDRPDFESADPIAVTAGEVTTGIDAQLVLGGSISGVVTDESGQPLSDACVDVYAEEDEFSSAWAYTDEDGSYRVPGLRAGVYAVRFDECAWPPRLAGQWYDGRSSRATADPVHVALGEVTTGIDAQLSVGGTISGTIFDDVGQPLPGVCVSIYEEDTFDEVGYMGTGEDGTYGIGGLTSGQYLVFFEDCGEGGFVSEWYDDRPSWFEADLVTVSLGQETSGINASLARGASISGRVTDHGGAALSGICVDLHDEDGFEFIDWTETDEDGGYSFSALPSGSYTVEFSDCFDGTHAGEWWDNQPSRATADVITAGSGEDVTGIDAVLQGPQVLIVESGGSTDVAEGGATDTYTVRLATRPTASVTVRPVPDGQVTVTPATLSFSTTSWSQPKTITVTAVNDIVVEDLHTGLITHAVTSADPNYGGLTAPSVTVNIADDDQPRLPTMIEYTGTTSVALNDVAVLSARLTQAGTGQGVVGKTVTFTLKKGTSTQWSVSATTDANGVASTTRTVPNTPDSYTLTTAFAGDPGHDPASVTTSFAVTKRRVTLVYPGPTSGSTGETVVFQAEVTDERSAQPVSGLPVTFSIEQNGTTVQSATATTSGSGTAAVARTLQATPGGYLLRVATPGSASYQPTEVVRDFTVVGFHTEITFVDTDPPTWQGTWEPRARLTVMGGGSPIQGRPIEFRIVKNGQIVASTVATTDPSGVAQGMIPRVDAYPGEYTAEALFIGESGMSGSSAQASMSILRRPTILTYEGPISGYRGQVVTLRARLTDAEHGAPIEGQEIGFYLGSTSSMGQTDASGLAEVQRTLTESYGQKELLIWHGGQGLYSPSEIREPFEIIMQYWFSDPGGAGTMWLNPATKEFRLMLPAFDSQATTASSMSVQDLPDGQQVAALGHNASGFQVEGVFDLTTGQFQAAGAAGANPFVMASLLPDRATRLQTLSG